VKPVPTPPVALTSLSIRDFRGIDSLDLDFRGPDGLPNQLVVIAGPNGCGKTAVLEAALMAAGSRGLTVGPTDRRATRRGTHEYAIRARFLAHGETVTTTLAPSFDMSAEHKFAGRYFS
jgi:recombinational DNA repair ATPase RecF